PALSPVARIPTRPRKTMLATARTPTPRPSWSTRSAMPALSSAAKVVEATYWSEYCYHAQMEPMNCVAKVSEDGQSAEIWTGTQFGALAANIISGILKTTPDKIKVNQQMLGGGYGRRLWPDAAIQATILSKITKKPGKLLFTPQDAL